MDRVGKNNQSIQKSNRSLILQILAQKRVSTRIELSNETNLLQASVSKIVAGMIEAGIVSETSLVKGRMGRRAIGIALNADDYQVMGVKIARRSFTLGVFNLFGEMQCQMRYELAVQEGAEGAMANILHEMQELLVQWPRVLAIGVAVPGPYLRDVGRIAVMSEFAGWEKINVNDRFRQSFDIPVYIEHDANAGALALWKRKKEVAAHGTLVNLLVSEGVGAGIITNGVIMHGFHGMAGEAGHMSINCHGPRCVCGNYGCLEMYCSSLNFLEGTKAALPQHPESSLHRETRPLTAEIIFEHMEQGDAYCIERVREVGRYLGYGVANIVYTYDPNEIIITDIMSGGGAIMLESICETVQERVLPEVYQNLSVHLYTRSDDSILYGAADVAIAGILQEPDLMYGFPVGEEALEDAIAHAANVAG